MRVIADLDVRRGGRIETVNLNHLRLCRLDRAFADYCQAATLVVADGMPIVWAGAIQGTPLPERVTGASLLWSLSAAAARARRSIFLAGGDSGEADATAKALVGRHPRLSVAGTDGLPPNPGAGAPRLETFRAALRRSQPDIVFVALPTPLTWQTIEACAPEAPGAWWVGVGAGFSFASGAARRAPRWMQRAGLEWLHRLAHDPVRLGRRYLLQAPPTAARLLTSAVRRRWARPGPVDGQPTPTTRP